MTALSPSTSRWSKQSLNEEATPDVNTTDMTTADGQAEALPRESIDTIVSTEDDFLPIQQHSRPATPDEIAFERDVLILSNGKTEEELNKHYKLVAEDLQLEGMRKTSKGSLDQSDVPDTTLTVASSVRNSLSQASQSTPPTSCDSSERQNFDYHAYAYPPTTPSNQASNLKAGGLVPPRDLSSRMSSRPASVLSSRSISSSIKSGWRRISSFNKKRNSQITASESSPSIFSHDAHGDDMTTTTSRSSVTTSRPTTSRRPSTTLSSSNSTITAKTNNSRPPSIAPSFASYHDNVPPTMTSPRSRTPSLVRGKSLPSIHSTNTTSTSPTTKNFSVPFSAPRSRSTDSRVPIQMSHSSRPLSPTREEGFNPSAELKAAQARTLRNRDLQRLRASQLAEQSRFLNFQADQAARLTSKHHERLRAHRKIWDAKEREMESRHTARETEIEARQLGAELDLERTLEGEKRTVEARLRHMEGYVRGVGSWDTPSPTSPTGDKGEVGVAVDLSVVSQFPKREISTHAIQMLNQQRRLKKQLPQLHLSRINVLREQQLIKLEKLRGKHTTEWDVMMVEKDEAEDELRVKLQEEETTLQKEFANRKGRMEWRWKVAEEMERRRLQDERGVLFAEMQKVPWAPEAWKGEKVIVEGRKSRAR